MNKLLKFALAGGDRRQAQLAAMLAGDGHTVYVSYMEKVGEIAGAEPLPLKEALARADCVILPLPALDVSGMLSTPLSSGRIAADELLRYIAPHTPVYGGRLSERFIKAARDQGITAVDYFEREELKIANAAATAEGAIQLAMEETGSVLCGTRALVIGYGRIGKLLANKLAALGVHVTVSVRRPADAAWAEAYGAKAVQTAFLEDVLPEQDIVFNTVPAVTMGKYRLSLLKDGCLCMDLASKPGGVDFNAAAELGVKVIWALSLPGEVAPVSAGAAIRDTVYNLLNESGVI